MSHTVAAEPGLTQGQLEGVEDNRVIVSLPGTDYRLRLELDAARKDRLPAAGQRVEGIIRAVARRVDKAHVGGRFIEPVYGRPRRVQGRVAAVDDQQRTLTVQCAPGCALVITLGDPRQQARDFEIGDIVGFDVQRGACFEPMK